MLRRAADVRLASTRRALPTIGQFASLGGGPMPLLPEIEGLLAVLAEAGSPPISQLSVEEARAASSNMLALAGDPIPVGDVREITIPVGDATIGARVYTPEGDGPHPIVMFFHGGGWVICNLDTHDNVARIIARDASALVVSVDYRMAPEHKFPTAVLDAFAATQWGAANADVLGGDASRIAVCGDSAGGNISAVVCQLARDRGGPALRFAALIYPATDMTDRGGSMVDNATGYFLELADMEWFESHYVAPDQRADPLASPLRHPDLSGLPPTFVATCEFDPLRDQGERYADALRAAGVVVTSQRYDGAIHAIANMTGVLECGRRLMADVAAQLRAALH
jgi:acetyl esterase